MYNRKQRRKIAKNLGLSKKETLRKNPDLTYEELTIKSMEAGKQIEIANREEIINAQIKAEAEAEARQIENFMKPILDKKGNVIKEGMTYEQAAAIVAENKRIKEKRAEKFRKKK